MVGIPIGTRYTSTVRGRSVKAVACEKCRVEYVYACDREVSGEAVSYLWLDDDGARERSAGRAQRELGRALEKAVEPIACPSCGWYQETMVREARKRRGSWLATVAIVASVPLAILLFILGAGAGFAFSTRTRGLWIAVGGLVALIGIALVARHFRSTIWDPNADTLWKRKRKAKEDGLFMFKEDYDREQAAAAVPALPPDASER